MTSTRSTAQLVPPGPSMVHPKIILVNQREERENRVGNDFFLYIPLALTEVSVALTVFRQFNPVSPTDFITNAMELNEEFVANLPAFFDIVCRKTGHSCFSHAQKEELKKIFFFYVSAFNASFKFKTDINITRYLKQRARVAMEFFVSIKQFLLISGNSFSTMDVSNYCRLYSILHIFCKASESSGKVDEWVQEKDQEKAADIKLAFIRRMIAAERSMTETARIMESLSSGKVTLMDLHPHPAHEHDNALRVWKTREELGFFEERPAAKGLTEAILRPQKIRKLLSWCAFTQEELGVVSPLFMDWRPREAMKRFTSEIVHLVMESVNGILAACYRNPIDCAEAHKLALALFRENRLTTGRMFPENSELGQYETSTAARFASNFTELSSILKGMVFSTTVITPCNVDVFNEALRRLLGGQSNLLFVDVMRLYHFCDCVDFYLDLARGFYDHCAGAPAIQGRMRKGGVSSMPILYCGFQPPKIQQGASDSRIFLDCLLQVHEMFDEPPTALSAHENQQKSEQQQQQDPSEADQWTTEALLVQTI